MLEALAKASPAIETQLSRSVGLRLRLHPGQSGIVELRDGRDAFAARALLADVAERTIDLQYYIWRNDTSGSLLFAALCRAADRGVRVRLLLDDNNTMGLDPLLGALATHPNIEVRLFNPFRLRRYRPLEYLTDFARLNRRMHNKSFIVDGQVAIVGGRNIGDEYFDANQAMSFVDLDVMAVGPVVSDVDQDFERYWQSRSAHSVESILGRSRAASVREVIAAAEKVLSQPAAVAYVSALQSCAFVRDLLAGSVEYRWSTARLVSDDPAKGLGKQRPRGTMLERLLDTLNVPKQQVQLISPYLVPTRTGERALAQLSGEGVRVAILTNALEATDVPIVHAGYAKRRRKMLEAGVVLYELMRESRVRSRRDRRLTGSSGSSLHAKTFSVDCARVFVGSFNLDPRSASLNTEMGLVIESPALAAQIATAFKDEIPARSYQVSLNEAGKLQWVEQHESGPIVHTTEPGTTWRKRAAVALLALLPIDWLL
ncbi:MAG TPA: phospholipase D family protein [Steroidobacteraceae bacterium]|nr:phospholipase D family protein [Steroidobacteraceae bacterium]